MRLISNRALALSYKDLTRLRIVAICKELKLALKRSTLQKKTMNYKSKSLGPIRRTFPLRKRAVISKSETKKIEIVQNVEQATSSPLNEEGMNVSNVFWKDGCCSRHIQRVRQEFGGRLQTSHKRKTEQLNGSYFGIPSLSTKRESYDGSEE